jgi:ATP-binding cassette, subfamily C (CFTR/MRP), member 1
MLMGLSTIRAYRQQSEFVERTESKFPIIECRKLAESFCVYLDAVDVENRAYFITIVLQRWLGIRLDFLGNILILGISIFGIAFRDTVTPAKLGVVLTYGLTVTQVSHCISKRTTWLIFFEWTSIGFLTNWLVHI